MADPVQTLFKAVDTPWRPTVVGKGSVIAFSYAGQTRHQIHDPYPLVIVADIYGQDVRGVNLHYLTLPYVRGLVGNYANNPAFGFRFIAGDPYIVGAFRTYKRTGISQLRQLDAGFLKNLLAVVRALDPNEIDRMREQVRQMIQDNATTQPPAQPGPEIVNGNP